MEFRILGDRLDVRSDTGALTPPRTQVRRLLTVLLLAPGHPTSTDALVELLGDHSDGLSPTEVVEQAVHDAGQALPGERLITETDGYGIRLAPADYLDIDEFRALAGQARDMRERDPEGAVSRYRSALGLWGDRPLSDLPETAATTPARTRLFTERATVREELADTLLAEGRHRELLPEVTAWISGDPLNEHLRGLLMTALYRSDRAEEALRLHQDAVHAGARPGPWLEQVAAQIRRDDPALRRPPDGEPRDPAVTWAARRGIDTTNASSARVYDYLLGGKDNFEVDRAVAETMLQAEPQARACIWQNRRFLMRAVRYLAEEGGIRQFLDIGTGLPTQDNVHQVVQRYAPDSRVVYVDNDPVVAVHARALMAPSDVAVVEADLRSPLDILAEPQVREMIDSGRPVALLLVAVLHFIDESDDPYGIVDRLMDGLPAGSHLVISHGTRQLSPEVADTAQDAYGGANAHLALRTREQITRFFEGLEMVPPGLVWSKDWRPDNELESRAKTAGIYAGVARKA